MENGSVAQFHQVNAGLAVELRHTNLNQLAAGGGQVLAYEVRPDGQLAVPAVDQDGQLDTPRSAAGEDRLDGGTGSPAGVQHIVHQNDITAGDVKRQGGLGHLGAFRQNGQIVPVEADIDAAAGDGDALDAADIVAQEQGERFPPAAHPDKNEIPGALVLFDNLMGKTHQRTLYGVFIHDLGFLMHFVRPPQKRPCRRRQDRIHSQRRRAPMPLMNDFAGITVPRLKNLLFVEDYISGRMRMQALFHSLATICRFP